MRDMHTIVYGLWVEVVAEDAVEGGRIVAHSLKELVGVRVQEAHVVLQAGDLYGRKARLEGLRGCISHTCTMQLLLNDTHGLVRPIPAQGMSHAIPVIVGQEPAHLYYTSGLDRHIHIHIHIPIHMLCKHNCWYGYMTCIARCHACLAHTHAHTHTHTHAHKYIVI